MEYILNGKKIILKQIDREYGNYKARRYTINNSNQNIWIPNGYINKDGSIKECFFKYNGNKVKEILYKSSLIDKVVE